MHKEVKLCLEPLSGTLLVLFTSGIMLNRKPFRCSPMNHGLPMILSLPLQIVRLPSEFSTRVQSNAQSKSPCFGSWQGQLCDCALFYGWPSGTEGRIPKIFVGAAGKHHHTRITQYSTVGLSILGCYLWGCS